MYGITAQVSLYPLGEDDLSPAIDAAIGELDRHGLERQTGSMSTVVCGDDEKVFSALLDAFRGASRAWPGGHGGHGIQRVSVARQGRVRVMAGR